ncbi:MAG: hypothetical protein R3282_03575, partial [Rhodothermales bacterium]|nr:hypothetical protein [Rhodothermales bacterium]
MNPLPIENIAAYKFVDLDERWVEALRPSLRERCDELGLKGTILLSPEGVNLFMSGERKAIRTFEEIITSCAPFSDLTFKRSFSADHSFRRMLVKVKKEIIPFGHPQVRPARSSANRISPGELRKWLDDGRRFVLLDTRND